MILDFPKTKYTVKVKQVHLNSQEVIAIKYLGTYYKCRKCVLFISSQTLLLLNHLCNALRVSLTCTVIASYEFRWNCLHSVVLGRYKNTKISYEPKFRFCYHFVSNYILVVCVYYNSMHRILATFILLLICGNIIL